MLGRLASLHLLPYFSPFVQQVHETCIKYDILSTIILLLDYNFNKNRRNSCKRRVTFDVVVRVSQTM